MDKKETSKKNRNTVVKKRDILMRKRKELMNKPVNSGHTLIQGTYPPCPPPVQS